MIILWLFFFFFFFFSDKKLKMNVSYLVLFITVALWDISFAVKRWGYILIRLKMNLSSRASRDFGAGPEFGATWKEPIMWIWEAFCGRISASSAWGHRWMTLFAKHAKLIILCLRAKKLIYYVINYAKMVILWVNFRVQSLPSCNPVFELTWSRNPSWPRILPGPRIQSGIELFIWFWFRIFLFSSEEMS